MDLERMEYWQCRIGPIKRKYIPHGRDFPLRYIVQNKFVEMFPNKEFTCSSGWGLTEEMENRLSIISMLPQTNPNLLLKIDKLLSERNMNN